MSDIERVRSALAFIPPDDRDLWVSMGMCLKDGLGDAGFTLWDEWSRQSDRYNERDARDVWRSCKAGAGRTLGTLFHEGRTRGWRDNGTHQRPTSEELAERRIAAERAAREKAEKAREHAEAATKALAIWNTATPVQSDHPYLTRKQVSAVASLRDINAAAAAKILGYAPKARDEPLTGRLLVVPIKIASELSTVELIDELGRKSALCGGAKTGGYWEAQSLPDGGAPEPNLLVGEGVATVLSAKVASGIPGVAVLSCGNLEPVARAMRQRFPEAVLVILADLDKKTGLPNPHAIAAARAVGGRLAIPDFGENRPEGANDFNDLALHRGREAVQRAIAVAKAPGVGEPGRGNGAAPGDAVVIETAIAKLSTDIGAIFEPAVITALKLVRESSPADYQRHRKRIKDAGASVAELDRLVCVPEEKGDGAQGAPVLFPELEAWPEPVDGAKLLIDLASAFKCYAILPKHGAVALALWTLFTHCIDAVNVAPILAITSPEKRCGKSTLLALLGRLALRRLPTANISAAALFRAVEAWAPTLLIDEADSFLKNSEDLRGILNSGHTRELAFVIRTVGDDHEPRKFSTWGAKAIALIGKLKDTLHDRSIEVALKRKLPGERVKRLRHADPEVLHTLARRCARWAADHAEKIRAARPSMPNGLHDRAEDNWEPLLAIAELAGGRWPKRARAAALALSAGDEDTGGLGTELLGDIRGVFKVRSVDRISSEDLVLALVGLEERRWSEYSHGKPITKARLARLLRPYGVVSRSVRLPDGRTPKGYLLDQFADAFKRYLPPPGDPPSDRSQDTPSPGDPPFKAQHRHNVDGTRDSEDFESATAGGRGVSENGLEPSCGAGCGGVADSTPPSWGVRL